MADAPAQRDLECLSEQLEHYAPLADRVLSQARRRVLEGEQVSAQEKLYSIFEPHTDLIKRGKTNTPVEFGHKVLLAESRRGLITDYQILDGNPPDEAQVEPSLQRHRQQFGTVPRLYATDRGFYSPHNVTLVSAGATLVEQEGPYGAEGFVRQAFAPLPNFSDQYPVVGSWLVDHTPCGLSIREDANPITGNTSRFLPHAIV